MKLSKYLLVCALGFGLGGLIWGGVLYSELPDLEYPFHFMAILIMGLFGGISLVWFDKNIRTISKSVLIGLLGWGVGFISGGILVYPLSAIGGLILGVIPCSLLEKEFTVLEPNIYISAYWLIFLLIGVLVGFFYALFLKLKIWPLIWRAGLGLALASLVGPVIGNLIGNVLNSLLISYLATFCLMGIILGLFLGRGVYRQRSVN
jgi:hypothetical protein